MKRFLSILLSLTICLTLLPAAVQVQAAFVDDLSYQIIDGQVTITDCKESASGSLTIPDIIDGFPVTSIGDHAFYYCTSLTGVTIPDSVTSIGYSAFFDCTNLTSVTIPDSVTSIGDYAFFWCDSLTSVTIPDSVTSIGSSAFSNCTSLTSVTIPDSVTGIGSWAFSGCSSLQYNVYGAGKYLGNDENPYVVLIDTIDTAITAIVIHSDTKLIGCAAFFGCTSLTSVTIPDSVTSIGDYAFYGCSSLTSVTIPDSVTSIGAEAFSDCSSLTSVTIPDSVTSIGDHAFESCTSLTSVTIPDSVTSIGDGAFSYCDSLTGIIVSENNPSYSSDSYGVLYTKDKATLIQVPGAIRETYTIPDSVTSIGYYAFSGCSSLTSVTIPDSVTSIGSWSFQHCYSLTSVTIPDSVTSIGNYAFACCSSLTSVTIPDSVTSIGYYAFYGCSSLTSVTIPDSVTSIGDRAFYGCSSLQYNVYGAGKYLGNDENPYVVLIETIDTAITAIVIHSNTKLIGDGAFSDCDSLTGVTIPNSVTSIGDSAFYDCTSLTSVTIGGSVTSIGGAAFSNCSSLTSVTIPDSVTSIGSDAFFGCDSLTSITIPDSVTSIGSYAFFGCDCLTSVTIPDSVTSIGDSTFYSCDSLTSIYFVGNAPSIDSGAFYGVFATAYYHAGTSGWENAAPGKWTEHWEDGSYGRITLQEVEHFWSSYTYDNNHTCTVDGTERAVCLTCGKTDIRRVEGTADHRFFYTSNNDATCTQDGTKTCICMLCNFTETVTDEGTTLDHADLDYTSNNDATCTQDGTKTRKCKFCDFAETVPDEGTALDHADLDYTSNNDATCTQDGTKTCKCKFCDFAETIPDEGTALGHSFTNYIVDNNYTCTVDGTKTAKCDRCDATDIQLDIGSMAHRYYYVSNNDATCTTDGTKTGHCIFCSKTVIVVDDHSTLGHSFANGTCTVCGEIDPDYVKPVVIPTLTLKAPTLEFKDMITVNAMFEASNLDDVVEMGMITYTEKVDQWSVETAAHVIPGTTYDASTGRYIATSQGIHAKYLGDAVYLACYAKLTDGSYVYTKLASYSPVQYATSKLKGNDTALKQLVVAMLNYGAAAQVHFNHNVDNLANGTLTAEQIALPEAYRSDMVSTVASPSADKQGAFYNNKGFAKRYPSISFEGAFCINYFFTPAYAPVGEITLYYWNAADYAAADVLTVENASGSLTMEKQSNGEYRGDITGIAAKALGEGVYVAGVYTDGTDTWTSGVLGYSIGAYCASQSTKGGTIADLAMATAVYGYQAKAYFN